MKSPMLPRSTDTTFTNFYCTARFISYLPHRVIVRRSEYGFGYIMALANASSIETP